MGFDQIRSLNFRNLDNPSIDLKQVKNIFLVGLNGQGKTNFLELVYYLCYSSSFRGKTEKVICKHGEDGFFAGGRYSLDNGEFGQLSISYQNGLRTTKLDNKIIHDRKELINNIPCVVFCHDDLSFVLGSPERKRWFFDQTLTYQFPLYVDLIRNYKKILSQRNRVLKEKRRDLLEIYTVQMIKSGIEIQKRRKKVIDSFNDHFKKYFLMISGLEDEVTISYSPSWNNMSDEKDIFNYVMKRSDNEFIRGSSLYGPHRDNFNFMQGKKKFTDYGSTGQMRLLSLILRIAQADFVSMNQEKKAILLLDDVLLELDRIKRKLFLDNLPPYEQAFFTFLPGDDTYENNRDCVFFDINEGHLEKRDL